MGPLWFAPIFGVNFGQIQRFQPGCLDFRVVFPLDIVDFRVEQVKLNVFHHSVHVLFNRTVAELEFGQTPISLDVKLDHRYYREVG